MTFPSRTTSLAATAIAAAASALAYPFLPDRVAIHFDAEDQPDRYGSRMSTALTFPAVMMGMNVVNNRLGAWPGGRDREDSESGIRAREQAIGVIALAILSAHLATLARALGVSVDMNRTGRGVFGLLMIALGNLSPKLPRNGLIGIRTPWTLSDPVVWERTHRLGGYLITAAGLISLATLPATGKRAERVPVAAILGAVGLSVVYSFVAHEKRIRSRR